MNKLRLRNLLARTALTGLWISLVTGSGGLYAQACQMPATDRLFNASLCVEGEFAGKSFNNIQDLLDVVNTNNLRQLFPTYDENVSQGRFVLDVRGLPAILEYERNSTQLLFTVPSLGISQTFNGATRDNSNDQFEDYIKKNGSDILKELLKVSPVDPMAGNPTSVQTQMAINDYDAGFDTMHDASAPGSAFGLGARFGSYTMGGFKQNVYTLPISYAYTFANHDVLSFRLPLTFIETDGANSYQGLLGVSYKKNISSRWALTPSIGYGMTGSSDLGSFGHIVSGSLTSDLMLYDNGKYSLSMGNMVGYYLTLPVSMADYKVNYNLQNIITRNGLLLSIPLQKNFLNREFSFDFFVTGTWFFGDALYNNNYQEVGFSFGPRRSVDKLAPNVSSQTLSLGLKYVRGDRDTGGVQLNFGYRF